MSYIQVATFEINSKITFAKQFDNPVHILLSISFKDQYYRTTNIGHAYSTMDNNKIFYIILLLFHTFFVIKDDILSDRDIMLSYGCYQRISISSKFHM